MSKRISVLIIMSLLVVLPSGCRSSPLSGEEVYKMISPSTVEITAESDCFTSLGSGFYIDDEGTVVTNYHVIEGCASAYLTTYDGGNYPIDHVVGYSKDLDIAILSTSCRDSVPLEFRTDPVATGENVYALGSSLGLTGTFSEGVISSAEREINGIKFIQTTAPISSGNSGGPLVDSFGRVIGITSAGFEEGQNLNLAIPISLLEGIATDTQLTMEEFYNATTEEVLNVAIEMNFVPYSFEQNGVYCGINIDIAEELANRLGLGVCFQATNWNGLFKMVDSGECDIAFGIEYTPEKGETYYFTDAYHGDMAAIFNADSFSEFSAIKTTLAEMAEDGTIDEIFQYYGIS